MTGRAAERVTVPDFVGMPVHIGEELAPKVGVTLTSSDPDGPGIRSLTWPGLFYITAQSPAAGTEVDRWGFVAVEIVAYGEADSGAPVHRPDVPPVDIAHAAPQQDRFVDLAEPDEPTEH